MSGKRSSQLRKRALRRLSHEQYAAYSALYEQVLSESPGVTRHQARGRAWTRLRYQFPDRYLELFALEQGGTGTDVPPDARGKSWQRACGRLAEIRKAAYQARYAEFRAQGMPPSRAYDRAIAAVRDGNEDLFARLLAEEYQRWLASSGAAAPPGHRGSADGCERAATAARRGRNPDLSAEGSPVITAPGSQPAATCPDDTPAPPARGPGLPGRGQDPRTGSNEVSQEDLADCAAGFAQLREAALSPHESARPPQQQLAGSRITSATRT